MKEINLNKEVKDYNKDELNFESFSVELPLHNLLLLPTNFPAFFSKNCFTSFFSFSFSPQIQIEIIVTENEQDRESEPKKAMKKHEKQMKYLRKIEHFYLIQEWFRQFTLQSEISTIKEKSFSRIF
ncbi:MAG: hypothetical protein COT84_06075 [Chlamydiae bacterium CG10_big_fil_rev_8_21_14_0_10_35_9]|nr:MAG: hypothetical protein COT84_06075 [Chlamydiae bacterium CG10_big_fil_rev_8_21_14_0_10_35_9]